MDAKDRFGIISHAYMTVVDQVDGNCWTNPQTIESKVRLLLEQNNIAVLEERPAFYNPANVFMLINAYGFRASNGQCTVAAEFEVETVISTSIGGSEGSPEFWFDYSGVIDEGAAVYTSGGNVNDQLTDFFEGEVSEFLSNALASRRSENVQAFRNTYPRYGADPMTEAEWEKLISDTLGQR